MKSAGPWSRLDVVLSVQMDRKSCLEKGRRDKAEMLSSSWSGMSPRSASLVQDKHADPATTSASLAWWSLDDELARLGPVCIRQLSALYL